MICSKCGQELKDGVKFCTKCGAKFGVDLTSKNKILSYLSIIMSVVGIVGLIVGTQILIKSGYNDMNLYQKISRNISIFRLFIFAGIILALISLYKQKCKLAFIAGLIPCGYFVLAILPRLLPFLRTISRLLAY
jgi:uncharacterized membrane protein